MLSIVQSVFMLNLNGKPVHCQVSFQVYAVPTGPRWRGGYSYKKRLDRKGCLFQVYEMVGNSTVEVLEKGKGNLSFPFVEVPEGLTGAFCGCENVMVL